MTLPSTALFTDRYELTMLEAALRSDTADIPVVFEVFARRLPRGRRYGVLAGTARLLDSVSRFRFGAEELAALKGVVDERTCEWLAGYRFRGDIEGYAEGQAYFEGSPVLVVAGTFGEAVLLETLSLSILNHDSAIASAAARMVCAAGSRPCIEMGSRRAHELAAVAAARAAYIAGFAATSNLAAGARFGLPTTGTSAHAFTLVHDDERSAFAAQVAALGSGTTLLVDTYDVEQGIRNAVAVAGPDLGAIRLDSGDLLTQVRSARALLDSLGATRTRIVVTSDLDEYTIAALAAEPCDGYGVGTSVVTGSGAPTAGFVYKLVERAGKPVAKRSVGKTSVGGRKTAARRTVDGVAVEELIYRGAAPDAADQRRLSIPLMRGGEPVYDGGVEQARQRWSASREELPGAAMQLSPGEAALDTRHLEAP